MREVTTGNATAFGGYVYPGTINKSDLVYRLLYRGYNMAARRYEISLRVLKNILRVNAANE